MDADPPFVSIDLETNEVKPLDRDIKKVGDRLALSPVSRHIATTQPGYIWFTKNSSDFYGNAVPAKNKTVQLKWLTDDLLLALIENNGIYHLMLVAPFVGTELVPDENGVNRARPTFIQYTATLEEDIVQFELIDAVLPKMISDFKVEQFPDRVAWSSQERRSQQIVCRDDRIAPFCCRPKRWELDPNTIQADGSRV
jgi:hypothetical protein